MGTWPLREALDRRDRAGAVTAAGPNARSAVCRPVFICQLVHAYTHSKYLGDPFSWGDIANTNPDQNPHQLEVGQQLNIPAKGN